MITTLFLALHWTVALLLTARLMLKKKPVGESLAWLFVVYAIPLVGAGLYYAFGERRQGDKRIRRLHTLSQEITLWQANLAKVTPHPENLSEELEGPMARFVQRATGFPPVLVEDWSLLDSYQTVFEELVRLFDAAKDYIHLEFYIWEPPGQVQTLHEALLAARQRGVAVRILVDSIGSDAFIDSRQWHELRGAGCELEVSMRMRLLGGRWDLRNHRKLVIVDGHTALAGSMNLVDPELFKTEAGIGKWIDAMVRVGGAGAQGLHGVFLQDWCVERERSEADAALWSLETPKLPTDLERALAMQVLPSGPGIFSEAIHQVLMMAIYAASEELILSTPYFVPGDAILQALVAAAMRGVRVVLVIPKHSDVRIASYAAASHFAEMLDAGIEIVRFEGGLLHTKSLTVDGRMSIFGTVNLDMRSLWLNSEVTLLLYNAEFTAQLRATQLRYTENATPLTAQEWATRPRYRRALENMARLLGPVI